MVKVDLRKELLGALIALAKTCNSNFKTENTDRVLIEGLVAAKTEAFGEDMIQKKLDMARQEKYVISPNCSTCASPCGNTSEYNVNLWGEEDEACQKIKSQMIKELLDTAQMVYQGMMLKNDMSEEMLIFYKVLEVVTYEFEIEELEKVQEEIIEYQEKIKNLIK